MTGESPLMRVGENFQKEIEEVKEERERIKIEDKKVTNGEITNIIPKHKYWNKIKEDLIGHIFNNKKGGATLPLIAFMFTSFLTIVIFGFVVFIYSTMATNLAIDVAVGQVNLLTIVNQTMIPINNSMLATADLLAYLMLFGMILGMFGNAYFLRDRFHRLFIILDIILMIVSYIIAVYISYVYSILINATTDFTIYIDVLPKASTFMINLPIIVPIVGAVIMLLSYIKLPRGTDEPILSEVVQ